MKKKLLKKTAAVSLALLTAFAFMACSDDPESEPSVSAVKIIPDTKYVESGKTTITMKAEKGSEIYYEVVPGKGKATITGSNYTEYTKYTSGITITENSTIYAVSVKNGNASAVVSHEYKVPRIPTSSDINELHSMILPSGTGYEIPAWTKAADAYATDIPKVVTGFTTKESYYTELNGETNRTQKLIDALDAANDSGYFDDREVKNVIVVFADGWGESHTLGSRQYYNNGVLVLDHLPYHAPVNHDAYGNAKDGKDTWTYDADNNDWNISGSIVPAKTSFDTTDSTAGGTAINTGFTTYYSACDVDIKSTEVRNIFDLAREKGMLVGNVTNDWLTDATPATVAIHSPKRKDSVMINGRMYIASPDFTMGRGGFSDYVGKPDLFKKFKSHEYAAQDPGHLEQWYKANTANKRLQNWAKLLLKEYDNKEIDPDTYDIAANWTDDRKLVVVGNLEDAFTASNAGKRPLVSYGDNPKNSYDYEPKKFDSGSYEIAPCIGYKLGYDTLNGEKGLPNYAEMVAATLSILDSKAKAQNRGFFAFIENTCPDGWGHATRQYDCLNEVQMTDEGVAIAVKYVLENPDTLLVITADHETGKIEYDENWDTDYKKIFSRGGGDHSSEPVPVYAFGAGAKKFWGDCVRPDMSTWTATDKAQFVMGKVYPKAKAWTNPHEAEATDAKFPKILRNSTTGIRIGKAMGFDKFGDLDGDGILDPVEEADSVMSYEKVATYQKD